MLDTTRGSDSAAISLVLALFLLYIAADLAQVSQALDGVVYADIARNLSIGEGTFWAPVSFDASGGAFHDHPPLGLWLMSTWFALWGDAFWVEKSFCLLLLLGLAAIFLRLWREVAPNAAAWLPLALLLSMPVTSHVLRNYPLDALVALFGLVAVWGAWRSLRHAKYLLVVIVACVVGVLIKGPVALFPIGAPACFSVLMQGDWRRGFIQSVVVTLGVAGLLGLVLLDPDASLALQNYFSSQVLASISGARPAELGRGYLLLQLGLNLGVVGLLVALVALLGKYRRSLPLSREFWCFVLIGVSACLPLLISPRLYRHYLMPGMPYFAIAAAMLLNVPKPTWRWPLLWCGVFVLTVALARGAWVFAQPGKDAQVLADAALITRTLRAQQSPASAVDFCHAELRLQTYLARHHQIRSSVLKSPRGSRVYRVCPGQPTQEGFKPLVSLGGSLFLWGRLDAKGSAN